MISEEKKQEFIKHVEEEIGSYLPDLPDGHSIHIEEVKQNNGTSYTGLIISVPDSNISPVIHLDDFMDMYEDADDMSGILHIIAEQYMKHREHRMGENYLKDITDYGQAKHKLFTKVVNTEMNAEFLEGKPSRQFGDLSMVAALRLYSIDGGTANVNVTENLLKLWGIDADTLMEQAIVTDLINNPYKIESMVNIIKSMMGEEVAEEMEEELFSNPEGGIKMYVLTDKEKTNGARYLLYPDMLERVGEHFGADYMIIPSSVHEVIIVPIDMGITYEGLQNMVQEVNATSVEEKDILSDHPYVYDRESKELSYIKDGEKVVIDLEANRLKKEKEPRGISQMLKAGEEKVKEVTEKTEKKPKTKGAVLA